ncbi:MAG: hypothetical protein R3Y60_04030 [bacterium]
MRKILFALSTISLLFLTGCSEILSMLEEMLEENLENTLSLSNEKITKETDKYVFEFNLDTSELSSYNASLDMEIVSRNTTVYEDTETFTVLSHVSSYSFDIYIEDISLSREEAGEFTFLVLVDGKRYQETLNINGLELKEGDELYLDDIIEFSASTLARESVKNNTWTNHSSTNLTNMIKLYDELNNELADFMENGSTVYSSNNYVFLSLTTSQYSLTVDQVLEVYNAVIYDNPIYYYVSKSVGYSYTSTNICTKLNLSTSSQYAVASVRSNYNDAIINYVEDCVDLVEGLTNDLDISLAIHDKIIGDVDYDHTFGVYAYDIIGVVANKGPVCESYAETYFMLMNYFDVDCYLVIGTGVTNSGSENHAWNFIGIDGSWYGVDVTWDDQPNLKDGIIYDYFGRGKNSSFPNSHLPFDSGLSYDSKYMYYMVDIPTLASSNLSLR